MPLFLEFLLKHNIVISWHNRDFGNGARVVLTDGFTVQAIAETTSLRESVLNFPELKEEIESYKIHFGKELFLYRASIFRLNEVDYFKFRTQTGICRVNKQEIRVTIADTLISYKQKEMTNEKTGEIVDLLKYKKQIILQGPPGTGKTRLAREVAGVICDGNKKGNNGTPDEIDVNTIKQYCSITTPIPIKSARDGVDYQIIGCDDNGITVRNTKSNNNSPKYGEIVNMYKERAWLDSGKIVGGNDSYSAAVAKYIYESLKKESKEYITIIQFHPSYTYEDFVRGISANAVQNGVEYKVENRVLGKLAKQSLADPENNYVLIIDEINRANLSSVLGELIYALEYREDDVESMYELDGSNDFSLPPNLYIIGTMNTADRSVGHIDYAIRRRFAFVDVPPQKLIDTEEIWFNTTGYEQVELLFNLTNVSNEFDVKDVQLGHSYFIVKKKDATTELERDRLFKTKMDYEVKPILREYVKDGILVGSLKDIDIKTYVEKL